MKSRLLFLMLFNSFFVGLHAQHWYNKAVSSVAAVAVMEVRPNDLPMGFEKSSLTPLDSAFLKLLKTDPGYTVGTGFAYRPRYQNKVYIITNAHVVAAAKAGAIYWYTGLNKYRLRLVGGDTFHDLAVLEFVKPPSYSSIATLEFSSDTPRLYDPVLAIAYDPDSRSMRFKPSGEIIGEVNSPQVELIHTIGLFEGNSGSPLFDLQGRVVGINTRYRRKKQQAYALPAGIAQRLIEEIIQKGRAQRAYLGIEFQESYETAKGGEILLTPQHPPIIQRILPGSPAAKVISPSQVGHVVTHVNGQRINRLDELIYILDAVQPRKNESVSLTLNPSKDPRSWGFGISKNTLSIPARILEPEDLGQIARIYMKDYVGCEVAEYNGSVVFEGPCLKNAFTLQGAQTPVTGRVSLVAGTVESKTSKDRPYQIQALKDLGVVIRLCVFKEGYVNFFGHIDRKIITVPTRLGSPDSGIHFRSLYN